MMQVNIKNCKKCAFCKHWYDPTNSAIAPKYPQRGIWEFEQKAKKKCLMTGMEKYAYSWCSKFEGKVG